MPNGATTSTTKDDIKLRKSMVDQNKVEAIIQLPTKLFANVGISVQCWILNNNKLNKDVLFVNADNLGTLETRKIRVLESTDIDKIVKTYKDFAKNIPVDQPGFSKKVSQKEIEENDYSLNPGRYVGIDESNKLSEEEIKIELAKASKELFDLMKEGEELEEKVKNILEKEINNQ